jgi:hypothetical protein
LGWVREGLLEYTPSTSEEKDMLPEHELTSTEARGMATDTKEEELDLID